MKSLSDLIWGNLENGDLNEAKLLEQAAERMNVVCMEICCDGGGIPCLTGALGCK